MKNRKYLCLLAFILVFTLLFPQLSVVAEINQINIYVKDRLIEIPADMGKVTIVDGWTMIPLRAVTESVGASVEWDQKTQTATINKNVKVKLGSSIMVTPKGNVEIDPKAYRDKSTGRIMVPLSFISKILDSKIYYGFRNSILYITVLKSDIRVTEKEGVLIVDTSDLFAPRYDYGYSGIDTIYGFVGFNESAIVGTRPGGSTFQQDIDHFNNTILKNTGTNFANGGCLDFMGKGQDTLNDWWIAIDRGFHSNNPIIEIRGWADNEGEHGNFRTMTTMNATAEVIKYYSKSAADAEAIWMFMDDAAKNEKNVASTKPYLFGKTKVLVSDPLTLGVDIEFLE